MIQKLELHEIHYEYVVDVMEQDPSVIRDMCILLDEIEVLTFVCEVDLAVCQQLVDPSGEFVEKLEEKARKIGFLE